MPSYSCTDSTLAGRAAVVAALALAAAVAPRNVAAQGALPPPPPNAVSTARDVSTGTWTEPRVIARAMNRSPAVQTAAANVYAARAMGAFSRVPVVGNPTVGVRAMVGWPNREASTYALLLGFPIDVSGVRGHWRRESRAAAQQAEAAFATAVNDARAQAREAYIEVAVAEAMVRQSAARVDGARELLARTQARLRAQAATALDVSLSEHELALAEAELAGTRRERTDATARLRALLDLPATTAVVVEPVGLPEMPAGLTREAAVARAVARRREPEAHAANARRLRISTDRLRAQAIGPLLLAAEYELQYYEVSSLGASAQWALPVLHTAQGERAVAVAEAQVADLSREIAVRTVGREAAAAWDALSHRLDELAALRERAIPALERTLALTESLFEAGSVDYFRVLLARQELAAARLRTLNVLREAWRARVALDRAMGGAR